MFVCGYTYLSMYAYVYVCTQRYRNKRNGEKFNAILRRFSIFVRLLARILGRIG